MAVPSTLLLVKVKQNKTKKKEQKSLLLFYINLYKVAFLFESIFSSSAWKNKVYVYA